MNNRLMKAIADSGISEEIIAATQAIATNRAVATPEVLVHFVGFAEPAVALTDTQRNTAILAILSHYTLNTETT